jgi:hypothetical protein
VRILQLLPLRSRAKVKLTTIDAFYCAYCRSSASFDTKPMMYNGMGAPSSYRKHALLRTAYNLRLCSDCGIKRARRADLIVELVALEGLPPLLVAAAVNRLHPEVSVLATLITAASELSELDPVVCEIAERIFQDGSVLSYPELIAASRLLSSMR